jgi:ATP/maltotriose-dependent transcriptional regulator MalT
MRTPEDRPGETLRIYRGGLSDEERRALDEGRWKWTSDRASADLEAVRRRDPGTSLFPVPGAPAISGREHEILEYIADGWSNEEIADRLGLSLATVKFHVSSLFRALGVGRRTEAVREAISLGLLDW